MIHTLVDDYNKDIPYVHTVTLCSNNFYIISSNNIDFKYSMKIVFLLNLLVTLCYNVPSN